MGELAGLGGCRIGWQRPGRAESQPGQKGEQARTHARQHSGRLFILPQGGPSPNVPYFYVISLFLMLWVGGCIVVVFSSGFVLEPVLFMVMVWFLEGKRKKGLAVIKMANHSIPNIAGSFPDPPRLSCSQNGGTL